MLAAARVALNSTQARRTEPVLRSHLLRRLATGGALAGKNTALLQQHHPARARPPAGPPKAAGRTCDNAK